MMAEAIAKLGRVDCLVNAAAAHRPGITPDGNGRRLGQAVSIDARAPFFLMQAAVTDMLARKAPGSIVNILSFNAHCGAPELAIYSPPRKALFRR